MDRARSAASPAGRARSSQRAAAEGLLSESQQMYLKAAYLIQQEKGAARVTDIARRLGVIKASVTTALRPLAQRGLLRHERYDLITVTDEGRRAASEILDRYWVLHTFLVDLLGMDEETASREACLMEHRMSEEVLRRLADFVASYRESGRRARRGGNARGAAGGSTARG